MPSRGFPQLRLEFGKRLARVSYPILFTYTYTYMGIRNVGIARLVTINVTLVVTSLRCSSCALLPLGFRSRRAHRIAA